MWTYSPRSRNSRPNCRAPIWRIVRCYCNSIEQAVFRGPAQRRKQKRPSFWALRNAGSKKTLVSGRFRKTEAGGEHLAAKFARPSIYVSYRPLKPRETPGRATVQGVCTHADKVLAHYCTRCLYATVQGACALLYRYYGTSTNTTMIVGRPCSALAPRPTVHFAEGKAGQSWLLRKRNRRCKAQIQSAFATWD